MGPSKHPGEVFRIADAPLVVRGKQFADVGAGGDERKHQSSRRFDCFELKRDACGVGLAIN